MHTKFIINKVFDVRIDVFYSGGALACSSTQTVESTKEAEILAKGIAEGISIANNADNTSYHVEALG